MDDSLQQWCDNSFTNQKQPWSKLQGSPAWETVVEQAIETAAFARLAMRHKIPVPGSFETVNDDRNQIGHLAASLIASCPLDKSDPPEILGSIHEYLVSRRGRGKARLSSKSRKSGGVFYTPQHVIEYIVNRSVVKRLDAMVPDQVDRFSILDPAVGCGGFLLTAYRALLTWYLNWYQANQPESWPNDVLATPTGWRLTFNRCHSILCNNLFGVDIDSDAIHVAQRILWLVLMENSATTARGVANDLSSQQSTSNLRPGHALIGPAFRQAKFKADVARGVTPFDWDDQFPQIARRGGFDIIIGNPPYRRERDYKRELDEIAKTPLGQFRSPRMDLWYYFIHRGIELLRDSGTLSFITNAYWLQGTGADKLMRTLRDDVHLDELFLLQNQPLFQGVTGQHSIFSLTKSTSDQPVIIKIASHSRRHSNQEFVTGVTPVQTYSKTLQSFFVKDRIDVWPPAEEFLAKLNLWPRLNDFGSVRQGIAENPSTINRRTIERYPQAARHWKLGEGVFSLSPAELQQLELSTQESKLLRPYHDLCDLGRYWLAEKPSRALIYSTRSTCPSIEDYPKLRDHLKRFRAILAARRETVAGSNQWWHLHWPRDEKIWRSHKLVALQMASRPSLVPAVQPTYVSFSTNVFVPSPETREDLKYLCGLLNSEILWAWFEHHAKHRGIGLELNGHVLEQAPIRQIDFDNKHDVILHDKLVGLVDCRIQLQLQSVATASDRTVRDNRRISSAIQKLESGIDRLVASLYGLSAEDVSVARRITGNAVFGQ